MINYSNVLLKKFVFIESIIPKTLEKKIWNLKFNDYGVQPGEVRYRIKDVDKTLRSQLVSFVKTLFFIFF